MMAIVLFKANAHTPHTHTSFSIIRKKRRRRKKILKKPTSWNDFIHRQFLAATPLNWYLILESIINISIFLRRFFPIHNVYSSRTQRTSFWYFNLTHQTFGIYNEIINKLWLMLRELWYFCRYFVGGWVCLLLEYAVRVKRFALKIRICFQQTKIRCIFGVNRLIRFEDINYLLCNFRMKFSSHIFIPTI